MTELLLVFAVLLLLFGATKLPALGGALGQSIKNFKKGFSGEDDPKLDESKPKVASKD
jgi:sec-independent protein translocase protein TatA